MSGSTSSAFDVVLADDFSQGYKTENWGQPFDGGTYWNGAWSWSGADVNVRDGVLDLTMTKQADGSWTGGGFNSFKAGKTITYGTIEFDGRVDEAQGTMGVFLTWPASDIWPRDGEIDILETPNQEQMFSTHYEGPDGQHWYDSKRSDTYDETQWNRYKVEWFPDRLTIKVNDNVVAEWTDPAEIPDVAHGIGAMGFVGSPNDDWIGGAPDGSTPDVVHVQMDNVVMSQWNGGTVPQPEPEPEPEPDPVQLTAGEGPDALVLEISQDAYQGSAEYTVSVDGAQVGGTFTASASASHAAGLSDTLTLKGDWGPGEHAVEVRFLNDEWGGTADTDRNLYVDGGAYNGQAVAGAAQTLFSDSAPGGFAFAKAGAPVAEVGTAGGDMFDATEAGGTFTGGGGRDLFVFEAGDGHATITDFASRTDKLVFVDFDKADVATAAATEGGVSGLLVSYGEAGSVFLAGVENLAVRDMVFA